tara:strand:- start:401 stop:991 length:591 start_codon:yes stop_codon:yes gene_type:complete
MVKIKIYRHGETNWNVKKIMQSHTDIPLNLTGLVQAFELEKLLKDEKFDLFLSSDLSRAHQTCRVATQKHDANIPLILSSNLRELNFGNYEGMDLESFITKFDNAKIMQDLNNPESFNIKIPGGESQKDVVNRFISCLDDAINTYPMARHIAIFTHAGVMRSLYRYLLNKDKMFDNCECLELSYNLEYGKLEVLCN